ncbi:hypothetical protein QFC21_004514 [Naganishia friedmannii]|uniref:Uncharacterized protein n=1 Tax=Naganishia friedmannii TaxID=89922 RepID=A0ACC2VFJ7_9TREE|nr:hypothetical protein QFC21_004514 [Naganishia friedmannii]
MSSVRQSCTQCAWSAKISKATSSSRSLSSSTRLRSPSESSGYSAANLSHPKQPAFPAASKPGRLSPSELRTLVQLHHTSSSFITQQNLSASIDAAFRASSQTFGDDRAFREIAESRLKLREGSGTGDRLVRHGQSTDSAGQQRSSGAVHVAFGYDAEPLTANDVANKVKEANMWSGDAEGRRDMDIHGGARDLINMREENMRDAMYGTVGKRAMPGVEAVLDHIQEHSK